MNKTADLIIALFAEAARLVVIRNYANIFWGKRNNIKYAYLFYSISFCLTTSVYFFLHSIIFNLLSTFAGILLISFSYKSGIRQRLIGSTVVLAISVALDLLAAVILMENPTSENYDLASSFISVFLFLSSSIIAGKIYKKNKKDVIAREWWYVLLITVVSTGAVFFLTQDDAASRITMIIISIVLFLINYIIYNLYTELGEKHMFEKEVLILKNQMNIYENQIAGNIKRDETIRTLRHDMKHHANELYHLAEQGADKEIKDYIIRMGEQINLATPPVNCGVPAIDGVLGYMIEQAKLNGIKVKVHVTIPESLELSSYDMNILLGNLMQNAIDSAKNCDDALINIIIKYDKKCIFLKITNPIRGDLKLKNGEYISTKNDGKDHGLGLKSVKNIVERYNGSIYFTEENGRFVVKAVLLMEGA